MGTILTLTGPSGAGKSTIAKELLKDPLARLVPSHTTREPRPDHLTGEYVYVKPEKMEELNRGKRLAWCIPFGTNFYATKEREIFRIVHDPKALGIMILVPNVLSDLARTLARVSRPYRWVALFVEQPPFDILERRLAHEPERFAEIMSRAPDEAGWAFKAKMFAPHIEDINNNGSLEETMASVRRHLQ